MTNHSPPTTTFEGNLEKITYYNRENHYTIAKLRTAGAANLVTVLGYMPHPNAGEALRVTGTWETHARYGQQLRITSFETMLPASIEGIKKYIVLKYA